MGNVPSDTEYGIATAGSLVRHGTLAVAPTARLNRLLQGSDGKFYSRYGIGYALLFVPVILVSDGVAAISGNRRDFVEQFIVSFTNTFAAAVIILLFFQLFIMLGYSHRVSLAAVIGIGCASLLLPYSKIIHSELPDTILLLLFVRIVIVSRNIDPATGLQLGVIASLLILLKPGNVCYAAVIGIYGMLSLVKSRRSIRGVLIMIACGVITIAGMMVLNRIRFGSVFNTGYGAEQGQFTTPLLHGLAGLLFSPSKSLFLFSPQHGMGCSARGTRGCVLKRNTPDQPRCRNSYPKLFRGFHSGSPGSGKAPEMMIQRIAGIVNQL